MGPLTLSEHTWHLLYLYLAESFLGIIYYFVFRHFGRLYRRRFLYTWALSWLAYGVYAISTAVIAVLMTGTFMWGRALVNIVAQMACFVQVLLILRGTHELVFEKALNRRQYRGIVAIAFVVAVVSVLVFSQNPDDASLRYLVRTGSRTLAQGIGFAVAGFVVLKSPRFTKGFGQRMLATSILIFSGYQFYYVGMIVLNFFGYGFTVPRFYGIADLMLVAIIGTSMIIWLLENEREKLEKANKELDRFLYSTSHDLRAPIASILGLTYLGKIEFEEERARTFMDMIESRIKKLDMVIADILSLSRSKKVEPRIEELQLKHLLDDTIMDIKFNKGASSIALDYKPDASHVFKSDYNQMKIVLANLLSNAVKYHNLNQPDPFIKVLFERKKDLVEISVQDNGQGIPEDSLPKIFEMFYRASLDTEGTGLGLYIVKEALMKIKGSIHVTSEFGKGSSFIIVLEQA